MGNEHSLQHKYEIQSHPYCVSDHYEAYSCYDAHLKPLTIFAFTRTTSTTLDVNVWKSVRHPFVLKYYDSGTYRGKKCIVTEPASPLSKVIENLTVEEVLSGLNNIVEALDFLHATCMLSHNFLSMETIFVSSSTNCFKIGSMQYASSFGQETEVFLNELLNQKRLSRHPLPPECSNTIKPFTSTRLIHSRDAFAFGKVLEELAQRGIPISEETIQQFCCLQPENRLKPLTLLEDEAFSKCSYLKVINMVAKFASLDEDEKRKCLESLPHYLQLVPEMLVASKLIPFLLTSRVLMLHPNANELLPYLFSIKSDDSRHGLISESLFREHVLPVICKLYCVHKKQFRLILLRYLPHYVQYITSKNLKDCILPQIYLGLKDENDELVSETFKALSLLVQTFGGSQIVGGRKKIFHNVVPKDGVPLTPTISITPVSVEPPVFVTPRSEPDGAENIKETSSGHVSNTPAIEEESKEFQRLEEIRPMQLPVQPIGKTQETQSGPLTLKADYSNRRKTRYSIDLDIKSLDIEPERDEIEMMFGTMEPKFIKKTQSDPLITKSTQQGQKAKGGSKFDMLCDESVEEGGWNEDSWE